MPPKAVRFSTRTAWDTSESPLATAVRELRAAGKPPVDLTVSNPTLCGFSYDPATILGALSDQRSMTYAPDPCGLLAARRSIADYYAGHGAPIEPARIVLTTSTSEAYSFLFRLLCDPGDEILVAQPSYPLFDFLADLDDVRLQPYPLFYDFGWWIDFAELERRIGPRTRAVLLVHPNNPTGHATGRAERERLEAMCTMHGLSLIVDEVFLDYGLGAPVESFARGPHPALTFVLSGLSKIAALPQMKVAWLACCGPDDEASHALERLDVIADTMLSMNAPAQRALPTWLASREQIVPQIVTRVRENIAFLIESPFRLLPVEAGWAGVLRLPAPCNAEQLVREAGVLLHPGSFYALPGRHQAVVSLITPPEEFRKGIHRLAAWNEAGNVNQED